MISVLCENSALDNCWVIYQKSYDEIQAIQEKYCLSYLAASVLANRDVVDDDNHAAKKIERFLAASLKSEWVDPLMLPNMARAIECFKQNAKSKIGILGDYDVDGVSSSVLLKELCDLLEIDSVVWLPKRTDGYGPSDAALKFFNENGVDCLLLADCGSNADEFIQKWEKPMIVLDHHAFDVHKIFPEYCVVVNPFSSSDYVLQKLCATALCFFFACEVLDKHEKKQDFLLKALDLVALATVCDIMDMHNLNRALVKKGLEQLQLQSRIGMKFLIQKSGIKFPLSAADLGFYIGPRLNAAGRLADPIFAFNLLYTKNEFDAFEMMQRLEKLNVERKVVQDQIVQEAIEMLQECDDKILCVAKENWHVGVVGIVAAKIQERFNKPTLVGAIENGFVTASARSNSINIGSLITQAVDLGVIAKGGGHANAAGCSGTIDEWNSFKAWMQTHEIGPVEQRKIKIDAIVTLEQVQADEHYKKFAPHGLKNEQVTVLIKDVLIESVVAYEKSIKVSLMQNYRSYTFFIPKMQTQLCSAISEMAQKRCNVIFKLSEKGTYHSICDFVVN